MQACVPAASRVFVQLLALSTLRLRVLLQELSLQDHIDAVRMVGLSPTQMQWIADGLEV
jgi:hypothetical protein